MTETQCPARLDVNLEDGRHWIHCLMERKHFGLHQSSNEQGGLLLWRDPIVPARKPLEA